MCVHINIFIPGSTARDQRTGGVTHVQKGFHFFLQSFSVSGVSQMSSRIRNGDKKRALGGRGLHSRVRCGDLLSWARRFKWLNRAFTRLGKSRLKGLLSRRASVGEAGSIAYIVLWDVFLACLAIIWSLTDKSVTGILAAGRSAEGAPTSSEETTSIPTEFGLCNEQTVQGE